MSFRRLVAPQHLNPANTLFGGTLMAWLDEACALFAMCQMQTQRVVTLKMSEVLFKTPARQNDFLEFHCSSLKVGNTSLTVRCEVIRRGVGLGELSQIIAECEAVFVSVDERGKAVPFPKTSILDIPT